MGYAAGCFPIVPDVICNCDHRNHGCGPQRVPEASAMTPTAAVPGAGPPDESGRSQRADRHAMTVDVEDYFQVEVFAAVIDRRDWDRLPRRVERNTERLLEMFAETQSHATFFT